MTIIIWSVGWLTRKMSWSRRRRHPSPYNPANCVPSPRCPRRSRPKGHRCRRRSCHHCGRRCSPACAANWPSCTPLICSPRRSWSDVGEDFLHLERRSGEISCETPTVCLFQLGACSGDERAATGKQPPPLPAHMLNGTNSRHSSSVSNLWKRCKIFARLQQQSSCECWNCWIGFSKADKKSAT